MTPPPTAAAGAPVCCGHDCHPGPSEPHGGDAGPPPRGARYRIAAMDCAAEESEIRRALDPVAGIRGLTFQLGPRILSIDAEPPVLEQAVVAIRRSGFDPVPLAAPGADGENHDHGTPGDGTPRLVAALGLAAAAEGIGFFLPDTAGFQVLGLAIAAVAIGLSGFSVYRKGIAALTQGRLNINALMTVAVTGAFVIGQWPEAAMVMALYAIAEAIEARAVDRARNAIQGLLAMAPEEAAVRQPDGRWLDTPVAQVPLGSVVRVRPGERLPMDGTVTAGTTTINQAPVTGESLPVDRAVGDPVFAGTINATGSIEVRVTALASQSTLARIIHAVETAQASRAPTQGLVDRFAAVYTPAVFAVAVLTALGGPWLLGWTAMTAVYKALVLLVIACPCALVISTPVTIVSGLAAAARRGILVKGGIHLENARHLRAIALDKTGTITEGQPRLVDWTPLVAGTDPAATASRLEQAAAALAAHSDHPVSRALAAGLRPGAGLVGNFTALAGRGVQGEIEGETFVLGNHRLMEERGQCSPGLEARLKVHEDAGRSVTLLASPAGVLALFAVADTIKTSSREAVAGLKALGIVPVMLSGDNQATASAIAQEAGIGEARGNLLPQDKLEAIQSLQRDHGPVAMTGDGINDAPALAQADLGVAMGAAGTDIAMEAADVVVMNDDLRRIPELVRLSRATHAVLWQNIALALGIKAVFLVLAVFGDASMWTAVFADMGASLLVVFNGMRLLRHGRDSTH